jgi:Glyoxalase-like domain
MPTNNKGRAPTRSAMRPMRSSGAASARLEPVTMAPAITVLTPRSLAIVGSNTTTPFASTDRAMIGRLTPDRSREHAADKGGRVGRIPRRRDHRRALRVDPGLPEQPVRREERRIARRARRCRKKRAQDVVGSHGPDKVEPPIPSWGDRIGRRERVSEAVGWLRAVVVDAEDPPRLAEFWRGVLGVGVVEAESDWIQLEPDRGGAFLAFEPAAQGETSTGFRTRPDIEALGGRLVEVVHARPGESHFRMADPEGNEFTVVLPLPPDVARKAYGPKGMPG